MENGVRQDLRGLQEEMNRLAVQVARIETLLNEGIVNGLKEDKERITALEKRIAVLEQDKAKALTTKNVVVWFISTVISSIGVAVTVAKFIMNN